MLNQPFHFTPLLKTVLWGGDRIMSFKGMNTEGSSSIGESWEISAVPGHVSVVDRGPYAGMSLTDLIEKFGPELMGESNYRRHAPSFPLLIKFIDAKEDLSVQVHPGDRLARERHNCSGKTELWNIIESKPGSKIYTGLKTKVTSEEFESRVASHTVMDVIAEYHPLPGDTFFIPAGRIHSIGAGNLLAEIQQTSDITYRIYDFGRLDKDGKPRQLHTAEAREAIDFTVLPDYRSKTKDGILASCEYFDARRLEVKKDESLPVAHPRDSFTIIICLEGDGAIIDTTSGEEFPIQRGDTLLFPATMSSLQARGPLKVLTVQS